MSLFFLYIVFFSFQPNKVEEIERIFGNICNKKNKDNIKTKSPILIYLYQSTDPEMNSVGNWMQANSKNYFKNRFTDVHIFPVSKTIEPNTLFENLDKKLRFNAAFTTNNKIIFAIHCHGGKSVIKDTLFFTMCGGHQSKTWLNFFEKIYSQTNNSSLALIASSCHSGDFFHSPNSAFYNKALFKFIITGSPLEVDSTPCYSTNTHFWDNVLNSSESIDKRPEVLILAYPMIRFLKGNSTDPTPSEMYQFQYDPLYNTHDFIPTPNFQRQWKKIPPINTPLLAVADGICPQKFMCVEGKNCRYRKGLYIINEEHQKVIAKTWNGAPIAFYEKKRKNTDIVTLKDADVEKKQAIDENTTKKYTKLNKAYEQILKDVQELETQKEWDINTEKKFKENREKKIGIYIFDNLEKYEGQIEYNKPNKMFLQHGIGKSTFLSGEQYIGEFQDGCAHGFGKYTFFSGNQYIGEWKEDAKNGFGIYKTTTNQFIGKWKNDKMVGTFYFTSFEDEQEKEKQIVLQFNDHGKLMIPKIYEEFTEIYHAF